MKAYNFFLDIDDTLIPSGSGVIPEENLDAIKRAKDKGCKFFINTGRPFCDVEKEVFSDTYFDGICSGGDYATYHGEVIYSHFMTTEDGEALLKELRKYKVNFNIGSLTHRYYLGEWLPHFRKGIYLPIEEIGLDAVLSDTELQKYVVSGEKMPEPGVINEIKKYFGVIKHPTYTEGFLHGHGKAFLMRQLEERLSLPHEMTVAIGDSHNDTDMLSYASVSVAMGNAPNDVKELCTFVTDSTENNGVARAIEMLTSI